MYVYKHMFQFVISACFCFVVSSAFAAGTVVNKGQSDYVIVLPDDAIAAEVTAGDELANHIQKMTGAKLPIVKVSEYKDDKKMLAVGFCDDKLPAALRSDKFGKLGDEEIIIARDGDTLLIAGDRPRGTLYAVYEYLHRLGVRWYTPRDTVIPKLKKITLPKETYRYNPATWRRSQLAGNNPDDKWDARNRLNSKRLWAAPSVKYGGGLIQGPGMETFYRIVPKPVLKAHPKWMAEVDGKREKPVSHTWGMCLTNKNARKYLIDRTMDYARKHPDRNIISLAQNDGSDFCTCKECKAFYKAHGGEPSSLIVLLINELAAKMKKEMPNRMASTLAYAWSLTPPKNIKVADNVMIMFCAGGDFFTPISRDPARKKLRASIDGWRKIAKHLDVYLYSCPFNSYWFVSPCTYPSAENIKWAFNNGITNIYTHLSGFGNIYGSESIDLRAWVLARLTWNPDQNIDELVKDFCKGYYGPAGNTVYRVVQIMRKDIYGEDGRFIRKKNNPLVPDYVNPVAVAKANELLEKAYDSLKDRKYKKRLGFFWIGFLWSDFWLGYEGKGEFDEKTSTWSVPLKDAKRRNRYAKLAKKFMIQNGVNGMKERRPLNPARLSADKIGIPFKAFKLVGSDSSVVIVPEVAGKIIDFKRKDTDFIPIKHYWGHLIEEYPAYGAWRDMLGRGLVIDSYPIYKRSGNEVEMKTKIFPRGELTKRVTIKGDALDINLKYRGGKMAVTSAFMLDLQPEAFGQYPIIYIEQNGGGWTKRVMGSETNFWYIGGALDITNCSGRIIFKSQTRPECLELTYKPGELDAITFEYDSYGHKPRELGGMVWFSPMGKNSSLRYELKIIKDFAQCGIKPESIKKP